SVELGPSVPSASYSVARSSRVEIVKSSRVSGSMQSSSSARETSRRLSREPYPSDSLFSAGAEIKGERTASFSPRGSAQPSSSRPLTAKLTFVAPAGRSSHQVRSKSAISEGRNLGGAG